MTAQALQVFRSLKVSDNKSDQNNEDITGNYKQLSKGDINEYYSDYENNKTK